MTIRRKVILLLALVLDFLLLLLHGLLLHRHPHDRACLRGWLQRGGKLVVFVGELLPAPTGGWISALRGEPAAARSFRAIEFRGAHNDYTSRAPCWFIARRNIIGTWL
jgi:hypothetical protein